MMFVKCNSKGICFLVTWGLILYMLIKYNGFLMMFTKIMGIYECSLSWCLFWSSVRDLLTWNMCSLTKLTLSDYMQHCFIKRYKRVSLFIIEFCTHNVLFYQLRRHRYIYRKYIWSDLHFIVDEKVKILHFQDEDKSWWSSILYNSVANVNRY